MRENENHPSCGWFFCMEFSLVAIGSSPHAGQYDFATQDAITQSSEFSAIIFKVDGR
jgi:hypothetical protein